ncbi:MAG TPA: TniQ family protein [Burkholderiaceae bacterium]|jgi:hypothetical protein
MKRQLVPTPFPDELLEGLLGRHSAINGCPNDRRTITALRSEIGMTSGATTLEIVATGLGIRPADAQRRLTTLPALRPFVDALRYGQDNATVRHKSTVSSVIQRPKADALACRQCVEQDSAFGNLSYWRRAHHLPGVDWCHVHGNALLRFDPTAFELPPSEAIRRLGGDTCPAPAEHATANTLGRYTTLLVSWLDKGEPYDSTAVNRVVQDGCRLHGLRFAQVGQRPVLSDMARQVVPTDWLALYWPKVLAKQPGAYLGHLDGICKDRHVAYPGATGALALAMLFDGVDDILSRLDKAQAAVASKRETGAALISAARKAFMDGASLRNVCDVHQIPVLQFEAWLRDVAKQWSNASAQAEPVSGAGHG